MGIDWPCGIARVSAIFYRLLLRSGKNVMCGWDGLIERSKDGTARAQCKVDILNEVLL